MDGLARCLAFDRTVALRAASDQIEIPEGWVARCPELPRVFSLNLVLLRAAPPDGAALAQLVDHWLGGYEHRSVRIEDAEGAERLSPALTNRGWERQRTLMMVLDPDAPARPADPRVRQITEAEMDTVTLAEFETTDYPPDRHPGVAAMLVAAQRAMRASTTALRFGAGEDGGLQSLCTLFMDEAPDGHRMAMVDAVSTLTSHRERGLAGGVVSAAISAAREWGANTIMVPADADDWPQLMYAKLGFSAVGQHAGFLRRPPRDRPTVTASRR
jgi:predicted N-acetyltransferase YhbS